MATPACGSGDDDNGISELINSVDSTPLEEDDLHNVLKALLEVISKWEMIGIAFGLKPSKIEEIEAERSNLKGRLVDVLKNWLKRCYNVDKFGVPSWRKVVEVVADPGAGENLVLAKTIAEAHQFIALSSGSEQAGGLEQEITMLERDFTDLVDLIVASFKNQSIPLGKITTSMMHLPLLSKLELGEKFQKMFSKFDETKSLGELFYLLSHFWDYLNPGLLEFLVEKFGQENDKARLTGYLCKMTAFRTRVKIVDYLQAKERTNNALSIYRYRRVISIMDCDWKQRTLQDAENFRVKFAKESQLPDFWPQLDFQRSSIVIIFRLPLDVDVDLDKLMPFFKQNGVERVFMDDANSWMKQERQRVQLAEERRELEDRMRKMEEQMRELDYRNIEQATKKLPDDATRKLEDLSKELLHKQDENSKLQEELEKCQKQLQQDQVPLKLTWREDTGMDLPFVMTNYIQSIEIQGRLYVGGGVANNNNNRFVVMYFEIHTGKWATLPPYKTIYFAMTSIDNHLALVGGLESPDHNSRRRPSKQVGVWSMDSQLTWVYPYHDMLTARYGCSAVVYRQWLVAAGGFAGPDEKETYVFRNSNVEVLDIENNQWFNAHPIPTPLYCMKSAVVGDKGYFMGGTDRSGSSDFNNIYEVDIARLIQNLTPECQSPSLESSGVWKSVPTPNLFGCAPLCIAGSLLAVGGVDCSEDKPVKSIHLYQPDAQKWVKIGDLPTPRRYCTCAMITDSELLVAGGEITRTKLLLHIDFAQIQLI